MTRIRIAELPPIEELTHEEMERILGAGRFRPSIEALEKRELMDAGLKFAMLDPIVAMKQHVMETVRAATDATSHADVQTAAQREFANAPYLDLGRDDWKTAMQDAMDRGVRYFNLSFINVHDITGKLSFGRGDHMMDRDSAFGKDLLRMLDHLRNDLHGEVRLSFGGSTACGRKVGTEPAMWVVNNVKGEREQLEKLKDIYRSAMQFFGTKSVDFDIEGAGLSTWAKGTSMVLRARAIKGLQAEGFMAQVTFTLPVNPGHPQGGTHCGLDNNPDATDWETGEKVGTWAKELVKIAKAEGVKISKINIMAMDYGKWWATDPTTGKWRSMGDLAISSANEVFKQMKEEIFKGSGLSDRELWQMIGITVNIGKQATATTWKDMPEFTLTDAAALIKFAQEKGVGQLSFWHYAKDGDHKFWDEQFKKWEGVGGGMGALSANPAWTPGIQIHTQGAHYWEGVLLKTNKMPPTHNVLIDWGDGTKPELLSWVKEGNAWVVRGGHEYTRAGTFQTRWQNHPKAAGDSLGAESLQATDAAFAGAHHAPQQAGDATKVQGTEAVFTGTAVAGRASAAHASLDAYYSHVAAEALLSGNDRGVAW
jgi:hypothetical protein